MRVTTVPEHVGSAGGVSPEVAPAWRREDDGSPTEESLEPELESQLGAIEMSERLRVALEEARAQMARSPLLALRSTATGARYLLLDRVDAHPETSAEPEPEPVPGSSEVAPRGRRRTSGCRCGFSAFSTGLVALVAAGVAQLATTPSVLCVARTMAQCLLCVLVVCGKRPQLQLVAIALVAAAAMELDTDLPAGLRIAPLTQHAAQMCLCDRHIALDGCAEISNRIGFWAPVALMLCLAAAAGFRSRGLTV